MTSVMKNHYLVDGGKARIIAGTRLRVSLVTPGDVMENQPFRHQLRRTIFRYKLRPTREVADTAYGTVENLLALEEDGITAFMPVPDWEKSSSFSHMEVSAGEDPHAMNRGVCFIDVVLLMDHCL